MVAEARRRRGGAGALCAGVDVGAARRAHAAARRHRGAARPLRDWQAPPACLLLTTFDDREALLAGLRAGARGYLRKDVTVETLVRAIRALAEGGTFFQPSLTEKLLRGVRGSAVARVPRRRRAHGAADRRARPR